MDQPPSSFFRGFAERASRGVCFQRRLKTVKGDRKIVVTPEASLRYWLPNSLNTDLPLCAFATEYVKPGHKVWDVGANIGVFTFLSAAAVGAAGRVLTVEADPFISQMLIRSAVRLPEEDARPEIVTAAVADTITLADFGVTNRSRASNHLLSSTGCSQTGGVRFSFKVPCVTLDWLLANSFPPDFVKIDIEGVEQIALAAAPNLLRDARPIFHLEVWSEIAEPLAKLFKDSAYLLFDGEQDLGLTKPLDTANWCTIAVPREKHQR